MERLLALGPISACFVLYVGCNLVGGVGALVGVFVSEALGFLIIMTMSGSLQFGLPLLIAISIENRVGRNSHRTPTIAAVALLYSTAIAFTTILTAPMRASETGASFVHVALHVLWVPAVATWFYIPAFVAKTLVGAEEGRPVRLRECPGTCLQFFLFPFGILFLQRRLQAVLLQDPTAPTLPPEQR